MSVRKQAEKHLERAEELAWVEHDYEGALKEYRLALQMCPDMPEVHLRIGQVHMYSEPSRLEDALEEFKKAVSLSPEWSEAHLAIANTLFEMDRFGEAIKGYRQALRFAPDDPRIHISLACCLTKVGHYAEAIKEYRQGISLKPAYGEMDARMMLADALRANGQIKEAIREWKIVAGMEAVWDYEKPHPKEAKRLLKEHSK